MAYRKNMIIRSSDWEATPGDKGIVKFTSKSIHPKGCSIEIDGEVVGVWASPADGLWIHFDDAGIIDSYALSPRDITPEF